jgi:DivIVA domain-containing protein
MGELFLFLVIALTVAMIVFGVTVLVSGGDPGLTPVEPDGRAVPLPSNRPLGEDDVALVRFDTALRGYRMAQVDQALRRAAYDIGYKGELIGVLEAEVAALRDGRFADADVLRRAREAALDATTATPPAAPADGLLVNANPPAVPTAQAVPVDPIAAAVPDDPTAPAPVDTPAGPASEPGPADQTPAAGRDTEPAPGDETVRQGTESGPDRPAREPLAAGPPGKPAPDAAEEGESPTRPSPPAAPATSEVDDEVAPERR